MGFRLKSRMACEVIGPIEARTIPSGRVRNALSSRVTRFSAVDALVKVIASGGFVAKRVQS